MVDPSNPWFSNLDEFSTEGCSRIRTKSSETLVSLASLLDYSSEKEQTVQSRKFKQIPFKSNCEPEYFYLSRNIPEHGHICTDSILISKKFLIESENIGNDGGTAKGAAYVVTILARYQYCCDFGYDEFSYLYHPYFSGVMIFSELDCGFDYVSYYENGELCRSEFVKRNEESSFCLSYLEVSQTKGGEVSSDGGEIAAAILIAPSVHYIFINIASSKKDPVTKKDGSGGGGGGSGSDESTDQSTDDSQTEEEKKKKDKLNDKLSGMEIKYSQEEEKNKSRLKSSLTSMVTNAVDGANDKPAWKIVYDILEKVDIELRLSIIARNTNGILKMKNSPTVALITGNAVNAQINDPGVISDDERIVNGDTDLYVNYYTGQSSYKGNTFTYNIIDGQKKYRTNYEWYVVKNELNEIDLSVEPTLLNGQDAPSTDRINPYMDDIVKNIVKSCVTDNLLKRLGECGDPFILTLCVDPRTGKVLEVKFKLEKCSSHRSKGSIFSVHPRILESIEKRLKDEAKFTISEEYHDHSYVKLRCDFDMHCLLVY